MLIFVKEFSTCSLKKIHLAFFLEVLSLLCISATLEPLPRENRYEWPVGGRVSSCHPGADSSQEQEESCLWSRASSVSECHLNSVVMRMWHLEGLLRKFRFRVKCLRFTGVFTLNTEETRSSLSWALLPFWSNFESAFYNNLIFWRN